MIKSDEWLPVYDPWILQKKRPSDFPSIEITRPEWQKPQRVVWKDMHPAMNVEGLYWRPAKP